MQSRNLLGCLTRGKVPFKEKVTLFTRSAPGGSQFIPLEGYVLFRAVREEQKKSREDPHLRAEDLVWTVWQSDLNNASAPRPKVNDVLQDRDSIRWLVTRIDMNQQFQCFALTCQRERTMGVRE